MYLVVAFIKMLIFGAIAVAAGVFLFHHGQETIRFTRESMDVDWENALVDLGTLIVIICCLTWVKQAWQKRHQGSTITSERKRRSKRKISDNIRIPK
jgi:hypothetical protein